MANKSLGTRMKENYENRTKTFLPRRTYTIIRLDGKAFHTYTRGMNKPFDNDFMNAMKETTIALCENIQGCCLGYTQSDEITLILTDFGTTATDAWYDGAVQKIVSVAASIATAKFNNIMLGKGVDKLAYFDARVFTISDRAEVMNCLLWRQQDCVRNSKQALGQVFFSQKELHGKNVEEVIQMCYDKYEVAWWKLTPHKKYGAFIVKTTFSGWLTQINTPDLKQDPYFYDSFIPKLN